MTGRVAGDGPTLLTGATGFVGSAVARVLAARGHRLRLLVRPTSDRRNLAGVDAELALGDLTDAASLARAAAGCRYVMHVAADYRFWVPDPDAMLRANVEGTLAVMRAAQAAGVERIVHCSSVAALGWAADGVPADETTPDQRGGLHRHLQAVQIPGRAGGAGPGAPGEPAGGDGQSRRAGRTARHQADADRQDDPGRRRRPGAGIHRYRAQHRACGRRGGGPRAGAWSAAASASATSSAARTCC